MGAATFAVAGRADVNVPKGPGVLTSQGALVAAQATAMQSGFHACEKHREPVTTFLISIL